MYTPDYYRFDYEGINPDVVCFSETHNKLRNHMTMQEALEHAESVQQTFGIHDAQGNKICTVSYNPETNEPYRIQTEPYENSAQTAENTTELICATEEDGSLTGEYITRQEARESGKRYLVCSLLLKHHTEDKVTNCVSRRSADKKIDPEKEAISAHGVAKLLFDAQGRTITDLRYAMLVNTALELNEELRHGHETEPFNVVVWPGSERDLFEYMYKNPIDDPNTVYMAGGKLFADHGYPLGLWQTPRTRFIINGHIFSETEPSVIVDPYEVDATQWITLNELAQLPNLSKDARECAEESYRAFLESKTRYGFFHSHRWVLNAINAIFYPDEPYIERSC